METLTLLHSAPLLLSTVVLAFAWRAIRFARGESRTDPMTGLGNRRRWEETTSRLLDRRKAFSFVLFDVANLKAMNSALGHAGADEVLVELARAFRRSDFAASRIGGDEFVIALPRIDTGAASKLRDRIEFTAGERDIGAGVRVFLVGAVGSWEPGDDFEARLVECDHALELRKAARKQALGLPTTREETLALLAA